VYGWAGPRRLLSPLGIGILALLVGSWAAIAGSTGGASFVDEVLTQDFALAYFVSGPWGHGGLLHAIGQAMSILLPWVVVLPIALCSSLRIRNPQRRREILLIVAWMAAVFAFVALSHRPRWRYYLPLCTPVALVVAVWLANLRWRWRTEAFVATWLVVAMSFVTGQMTVTARHARSTDWEQIAVEATKTRGALFSLGAPEIV